MLRLREWRERRGFSLRQLAEKSGVHYISLHLMEKGRLDPRLSTLQRVAKTLQVGLSDLVQERPLGGKRPRPAKQ
jgi:transcriptional regulator with XRE-family HTH domain